MFCKNRTRWNLGHHRPLLRRMQGKNFKINISLPTEDVLIETIILVLKTNMCVEKNFKS